MIIDTHTHCYWDNLAPRIDEILENMRNHGVVWAVQIGCDITSSLRAITLAEQFPGVFYATVWLHPCDAKDQNDWRETLASLVSEYTKFSEFLDFLSVQDADFWIDIFARIPLFSELEWLLVKHRKSIVAIGECGLDFHYLDGSNGGKMPIDFSRLSERAEREIENQQFFWLAQSRLAEKYRLPLVIHTRDARDATLTFMRRYGITRAVMHCYSEDVAFAEELMRFSPDVVFAFGGVLTYKNAQTVQETAKMLPIDRILLETDAPFLAPQAVRGTVNEPANTRYVLDFLATLRSESPEELERCIYENSCRFYGIP